MARILNLFRLVSTVAIFSVLWESSVFAQINLDSNLVAFYPFTINAGDSSGNSNHGTLFGGALASGNLIIGNNSSDYLSLPNGVLNGVTDFAISAEVLFSTSNSSLNNLLSAAVGGSTNELLWGYNYGTDRWYYFLEGVAYDFSVGTSPQLGISQHVVLQRRHDTVQCFRNGLLLYEEIVTASQIDVASGGLIIGQEQDAVGGSFDPDQSLSGEVDNLRFYHRPLSGREIDSLNPHASEMNVALSFTALTDYGVVVAGNQTVSVTVANRSAADLQSLNISWEVNGVLQPIVNASINDLPLGDSVEIQLGPYPFVLNQNYEIKAWTTAPNGSTDQIPSDDTAQVANLYVATDSVRQALYLDGNGDYANLNWSARGLDGLTTFTIEFWLKSDPNGYSENAAVLGVNRQNIDNRLLFFVLPNGTANAGKLRATTSASTVITSNRVIADGGWHHVAYVKDGSNVLLYVDGTLDITSPGTVTLAASDNWSVGQEYDNIRHSNFYAGYVDELRIWSTARSETDIQDWLFDNNGLYQQGGLISVWHFDSFAETIAYDRKSCRHGFLFNNARIVNNGAPISDIHTDPLDVCGCTQNVDLDTWDQKGGFSFGTWQQDATGTSVEQLVNVSSASEFPTFLVSPQDFMNVRIGFDMEVTTSSDNDFIGFVFGYRGPDVNPREYDFWLFDWKKEEQTFISRFAPEGKFLSRVQGDMTGANSLDPFWAHSPGNGVTVVDSIIGIGTGWEHDSMYHVTLTFTSSRAIIEVNGDTLFDHTACYNPGKFGFYAFSQRNVVFSNLSYEPLIDFTISDQEVCTGKPVLFQLLRDSCEGGLAEQNLYRWEWNYGDGATSIGDSASHTYTQSGTFLSSFQATDVLGCNDTAFKSVQVVSGPTPDLGADTSICPGDTLSLSPNQGFPVYSWNTGETGPSISVADSGLYVLSTTSDDGCSGVDSIFVALKSLEDSACQSVGITPATQQETVSMYPNPAYDRLTIETLTAPSDELKIRFISLLGRETQMAGEIESISGRSRLLLDISSLAPGIHIVVISQRDQIIFTQKLVKE